MALFQCIAITAPIRSVAPDVATLWARRFARLFADQTKVAGKLRVASLRYANMQATAAESAPSKRSKSWRKLFKRTKKELAEAWDQVGGEIGAIPSRQGGKRYLLPSEILRSLDYEASQLMEEVGRHKPSTTLREKVRDLLLSEPTLEMEL